MTLFLGIARHTPGTPGATPGTAAALALTEMCAALRVGQEEKV